jgi:type I restriction enzyme, S subunit
MKQDWELKRLDEVCTFINGRAYKKPELLDDGKYLVLRVGNFFTNNNWYYSDLELPEDKYCDNGDLLYAWSASFGPRIWEGEKVIYHYHIWKIIPDIKLVTKEFLYLLLDWDTEKIKSDQGTGTTMMHVSKGSMEARVVPIPLLPEQKRIITILDKAFAAIAKAKANAEQNLNNAKELFESYLQGVFENKGEGWEEKTLGEVCSLITDGKHGNCKNEDDSGYYFLSAKDVRDNTLLFDNGRQITKKDFLETHQRTDLNPGDICLINTGATIGRISFAPDDPRTFKTTFQKSVAVIKTIKNLINNNYCRYLLVSDLKKLVKVSSGTAVQNLLLGDLKKHKINLPKSLKEQTQLVQKLDALSAETKKLEAIYQQKIDNLEELKKSILQKAFNGELT